jgi:hypothetical protein
MKPECRTLLYLGVNRQSDLDHLASWGKRRICDQCGGIQRPREQGISPKTIGLVEKEGSDPGRIAVAAPRLGVPGRFASRERTCDTQLRRLCTPEPFRALAEHPHREEPQGAADSCKRTQSRAPPRVRSWRSQSSRAGAPEGFQ